MQLASDNEPTGGESVADNNVSRRTLLTQAAGATALIAGVLAAGCGSGSGSRNISPVPSGGTGTTPPPGTPGGRALTEPEILNFALNLEYLEAEYYLRAVSGNGLSDSDTSSSLGSTGGVTGGRAVTFTTPAVQQYAQEIANDELAHVRFLRRNLQGAAVPRPAINFTAAFNAAAAAAGIGASFDPFASELNFLVGSFIFEDVGVTAYKGSARFLTTPAIIEAAAGILAVEAIHAGLIRSLLYDLGATPQNLANQITALRGAAGGGKDEPLTVNGAPNFVPADGNARVYGRTVSEVLRIVYLSTATTVSSGGFFPNGTNGVVQTAAG